jgi:hypothetical protein
VSPTVAVSIRYIVPIILAFHCLEQGLHVFHGRIERGQVTSIKWFERNIQIMMDGFTSHHAILEQTDISLTQIVDCLAEVTKGLTGLGTGW